MAQSPTDLSRDFVKSGNRLITQVSSDTLLNKAQTMRTQAEASLRAAMNSDTADPTANN